MIIPIILNIIVATPCQNLYFLDFFYFSLQLYYVPVNGFVYTGDPQEKIENLSAFSSTWERRITTYRRNNSLWVPSGSSFRT